MENEHFYLKSIHDKNKYKNDEKYKEHSKRRLIENIGTRLRTLMIGSLSRFEKEFGYLWGHNKSGIKTKEQIELSNKWQKIRTEILDLGNNNIREAEKEIAQYTLSWNKYKTDFIIVPKDKQEKRHE